MNVYPVNSFWQHCHTELQNFLHHLQVLVTCVQETKLVVNSTLKEFTDYATIRRDRHAGGGDILPNDDTVEVLAVEADLEGTILTVVNFYVKPAPSCPQNYASDLDVLQEDRGKQLMLGDFNTHHPSWFSRTGDDRAAA